MLWYSSNNSIIDNMIKENKIGVWFYEYSYENSIYLNCLINNSYNAFDDEGTNKWDNGFKGNHWSDYTGLDNNGDGIGDSPYNITLGRYNSEATNQDNFPLMMCPF